MRAAASRLPWLLMGLILGVLLASSWRWAANVALGDTPRASFGLPVAENPPSQPAPSTGFRRPPPLPAAVPSIAAPPSLPGRPAPTPIFPESAVDAAVEPAPAVSPRVAPREGRPTADRATREAILDLRQALGNPLSGTALEGADSEEFAEALARVREEIAAHSSHDFEHAAAPATEATSRWRWSSSWNCGASPAASTSWPAIWKTLACTLTPTSCVNCRGNCANRRVRHLAKPGSRRSRSAATWPPRVPLRKRPRFVREGS
jgi:hypothetical protein